MDPHLTFTICNYAVLPAWLLLLVAPHKAITQRLVHALWIPALLTLVYTTMLLGGPEAPEGASFSSLEGVMLFFTMPHATLAGWVHFLAFDLFIGAWETRDARRRGIRHVYIAPCLFLTLMLGPIGLTLYLLLRLALRRTTTFDESASPA
ncbi:MAG: ABA4-like family protein [Myxococcota bacterium]